MIPHYGKPPLPGQRYRRRPGVYGLLIRDGMVLLTLQSEPEPDMQLPGGGIDPGESPVAALHREVAEETGWAISTPRRLGTYRRFDFLPGYGFYAEKICHIWLARPVVCHGAPTEPFHRAIWMPLADVPDAMTEPGARVFLRRLIGGNGRLRAMPPYA